MASSSNPLPSFAETNPVGYATITQPPTTATSIFKVAQGEMVTLGWSLTFVLATPTSLTLSAVANGISYAVGPDPDGKIPGTATQVVWDVYSYQQAHPNTPLAQATYTLHMWDDRGPSATPQAGYMRPNTALAFALYTPQPYTAVSSGDSCADCNGALTNRPAFAGLLLTFLLVIVSSWRVLRTRA
ncbi:hypothetical protein C8R43DRAFT_1019565 [Mycena crocata]|nr:hypothetical protein C8R43DRAFT_1019565 [Mycena crocata]